MHCLTLKISLFNSTVSQFTGEESFGRFLDLHEHYTSFLNLKHNKVNRIDYVTYIQSFFKFDDNFEVKDRAYNMYDPPSFSCTE